MKMIKKLSYKVSLAARYDI